MVGIDADPTAAEGRKIIDVGGTTAEIKKGTEEGILDI
jgi:hypothetical protein